MVAAIAMISLDEFNHPVLGKAHKYRWEEWTSAVGLGTHPTMEYLT